MLYNHLLEMTVPELNRCLKQLHNAKKVVRKNEIIDELSKHLLSEKIEEYWSDLTEADQLAVAEALYSWQGKLYADRFTAKYGADKFSQLSHVLNLFFFPNILPEDLQPFLKKFVPKPTSTQVKTVTEIPDQYFFESEYYSDDMESSAIQILSTEALIRHDLPAVLNLVKQGKISVSEKTKIASKISLRAIECVLLGGDYYQEEQDKNLAAYGGGPIRPIRPYAWPLLLQSSGLVKRIGKKLTLTRKGIKALTEPFAETAKHLYECWRDKALFDEYSRINLVKGQKAKGRIMTPPKPRRSEVELILMECPIGEWINIEDLFRFIRASDFDLDVCNNYYRLYLGEQNYGTLAYADNLFEIIEGRYIMVYFFEYLATLGLLDIAYTPPYYIRSDYRNLWAADDTDFLSRYDGLLYIRLNALGEYCLGLNSQYEPEQIETPYLFEINRHLEISLIREIQPEEEQILTLFASKNSDNEWEFSESKTLATIEAGQKTQDFYEFLKQRTETDLAVEVKDFFAEQDHKASAFVDGGRAQIIHSSAHLIKIISSENSTKNLCHKIDAITIIVLDKKEKEFYKALKQLGYLFLLTDNH